MELTCNEREALEWLEEELWREATRFDPARMNEGIAGDFFEFGMSGRLSRRQGTPALARRPIDAVLPLPDLEARLLAPEVAQVTYRSAVTHDGIPVRARLRSIRSPTGSGWVLRLRRGTPIRDDP